MSSPQKRKVAIFTGNRAEYGQLYPVIRAIAQDDRLDYYLLASGAHLQEDFGYTVREIEGDGFRVYRQVEITMRQDTLFATAQAIGSGILSLSGILDELKPDFLVVSADRYEGLAAVITGSQMNVPTAHVEGGDLTEGGALDDSVRHAMTKLAHLHFATNDQAASRVLALGEEPWRVHNVGLPALDLVAEGNFATPAEVMERLSLSLDFPIVAFTQHSVTTEFELAADQVRPSLAALEVLAKEGYQIVVTYPNNDAGGRHIIKEIATFQDKNLANVRVRDSLGRYYYHGLLNLCGRVGQGVCVGNSSSGIKETPAFGCPVVNIGSRQNSRLRAENVIEVGYDRDEILAAVRRSVKDDGFRSHCQECPNPYGAGNAGPRIAEVLATIEIDRAMLQKQMTF